MNKGNKLFNNLFLNVYADSYMNTVTRDTDTALGGGEKAVKLDYHVRVVYSKEIEFKAMPIMRFAQFAKYKEELGVQPGLQINMLTYNNLKKGGVLTEGVRMKTQAMSASQSSITVGERGNAVAVSELALVASFTDIMEDASTLLGRDMALTLDCEFRDTVLGGVSNTIYGRLNKDAPKVVARGDVANSNILSVATIKDAVEILATSNTPKFEGNYYIGMIHPHQSRTLRDDPAWIDATKYGSPDNLFTGEIGRIDDVRFIETTLMTNGAAPTDDVAYSADLAGKGAGGINLYQGLIIGEDCYGWAVALPVELRDNGVVDFGREHALAWYSIWGTGVLHASRGVVLETA